MTRRMLINAQSREEMRIAVLADSTLDNYQVEHSEGALTRGNIYRGVISNLQGALNAAFVDYGAGKNGFLAIQDVVPEARYKEPSGKGKARIDQILEMNKPIVVQVVRDPEGAKGAALTTNLSLAGRYLVLTPFDSHRGISRKVEDDKERGGLREIVDRLELPAGAGVIVRTNALGENKADLQKDLAALLRIWRRIQEEAVRGHGAKLLYSDQDLVLRALRDHLEASIEEVWIDDEAAFLQAEEYMQAFLPRTKTRFLRYTERVPLFVKFAVESQIDRVFHRTVPLASGGSIVIDTTEALTAIDVNSGRGSGSGGSHEEMALATNLEAAREVARQLRLRDLGGIVVVDFIDLKSPKHRRQIERTVKEAMKRDKARSTIGRISPNGLLEINRQRVQQALHLRALRPCPTCQGTGRLPSVESIGLALLRRIEARAASGRLQKARIEMHPELAEAVQNGRRNELAALEREFGIEVEIVASHRLHGPEEQIEWRDRLTPITFAPVAPASESDDEPLESSALVTEAQEREIEPADAPTAAAGPAGEVGRRRRRRSRRRGRRGAGERRDEGAPTGASVHMPASAEAAVDISNAPPATGEPTSSSEEPGIEVVETAAQP